jgi:hypothetical protein
MHKACFASGRAAQTIPALKDKINKVIEPVRLEE